MSVFGHIPGYPPGAAFESRRDLAASGVHRPLQAGICGTGAAGAESVVLAGSFVDDLDLGDTVLYTGAGGRNPATGRQVAPQTLNATNLALATSQRLGLPVRVVRRAHPDVFDRPDSGYRYDGLYRVEDHWPETGLDGFRVWRFRLQRIAEAVYEVPVASGRVAETPGLFDTPAGDEPPGGPRRAVATVSRVIRDTAVTRDVKRLHRFRCQMCGTRVETPTGPYAEAAHIRPLGRPHDGPDTLANVLCLCPTHHAAFDLYGVGVAADGALIGLPGRLRAVPAHVLDPDCVQYRRDLFDAAQGEAARQAA